MTKRARLSTAQAGKAKNDAAGNAAPPAGGSAGQARATASATMPAREARPGNLFSVRELQGAPTYTVHVGGRLHTGLWLHGMVTVLGTGPPLSPVTCRDCGRPFGVGGHKRRQPREQGNTTRSRATTAAGTAAAPSSARATQRSPRGRTGRAPTPLIRLWLARLASTTGRSTQLLRLGRRRRPLRRRRGRRRKHIWSRSRRGGRGCGLRSRVRS